MALPEGLAGVISGNAIVSFCKPRANPFEKKVLKRVGDKTIDEAIVDTEARKQEAEVELQEAIALEQAQMMRAKEAKGELDQAQAEVATQIDKEIAAAENFRQLRANKVLLASKTYALREELFEAQKKVALMEILEANRAKMKLIAAQAEAAVKAAEEAKRQIYEQKRAQKQTLDATRRAWADKKGGKHAAKAMACEADEEEPPSKRPMLEGRLIPSPTVSSSPVFSPPPKRPVLEGKLTPSPTVSLSSLKRSTFEVEECAPTIVQTPKRSRIEIEESTCTLFDDAQPPSSL